MATGPPSSASIKFGPFEVANQVFLKTAHSFALVNLKPLVSGHVLVCPLHPHQRLTELSPAEMADLWGAVQVTERLLAREYFPAPGEPLSGSYTVAVQDGAAAGQTVPHLHVHVIPRLAGDMPRVDDVYVGLANEEGNVGGALWDRELGRRPEPTGGMPRIEDSARLPREPADMAGEAMRYKNTLKDMGVDWWT